MVQTGFRAKVLEVVITIIYYPTAQSVTTTIILNIKLYTIAQNGFCAIRRPALQVFACSYILEIVGSRTCKSAIKSQIGQLEVVKSRPVVLFIPVTLDTQAKSPPRNSHLNRPCLIKACSKCLGCTRLVIWDNAAVRLECRCGRT